MSWDIYGERLSSGHCEVHPWVHEEFPCSLCIAGNKAGKYFKEQERLEAQEREEYFQQLYDEASIETERRTLMFAAGLEEP